MLGRHVGRVHMRAALAAVLVAINPLLAYAQIIAGGMFSTVANEPYNDPYFRCIAEWRGTLGGSTRVPQWLSVTSQTSEVQLGAADLVHALVFEPSLRWLIIGGEFGSSSAANTLRGALLRAELPGRSELKEWHYFYKQDAAGNLVTGPVYALEYNRKTGASGLAMGWDLYIGGDFTVMSTKPSGKVCISEECIGVSYVARCVYEFDQSHPFCHFEALPTAADQAVHAPKSCVLMLAFDSEDQILYTGGSTGPIRKYDVLNKAWSFLAPAVGIDATARPLDLLFDAVSGLGFIAYAAPQPGSNGVRIFKRDGTATSFATLDSSDPDPAYFSALTLGIDEEHGRVLFVGGSSFGCPALWFLPLGARSPSRMAWQSRNLQASVGGCWSSLSGASSATSANCSVRDEDMVQELMFVEEDNVLVIAGDFDKVSETKATNIAMSRDAGRSWSALRMTGVGSGHEGLKKSYCSNSGATVGAVVAIPQVDVSAVHPQHVTPLGGELVTLYGAGFMLYPGRNNGLVVKVGDSGCDIVQWVSDSSISCRTLAGFGDSLMVSAGLSPTKGTGLAFSRQQHPFSYSAPVLGTLGGTLTKPAALSIGGGGSVTVFGRNFGRVNKFVTVSIGDSSCDDAEWISDSSIRCVIAPAGVGPGEKKATGLLITATLGARIAEAPDAKFSYMLPAVTAVIPAHVPTAGIGGITLLGNSFGSKADVPRRIIVGQTKCQGESVWISDTALACAGPGPGVGGMALSLTVASQSCAVGCSAQDHSLSSGSLLKYAPPLVSSIFAHPTPLPTAGFLEGAVITVKGSNFGPEPPAVSVGYTKCKLVTWLKDDALVCHPAPGAGAQLLLRVEAGGQIATWQGGLKYENPVLLSFTPRLLPRDGATVTLRGTSFVSDPSLYEAVWVRKGDVTEIEYTGSIVSIDQLIIVKVPEMSWRGPATFFMRVRAGADATDNDVARSGMQKSNIIDPACEVASQITGTLRPCIHFSERSASVTFEVSVVSGTGDNALVSELEGTYNVSKWRRELALMLNMANADLLYIQNVVRGGGLRGGVRRTDARGVRWETRLGWIIDEKHGRGRGGSSGSRHSGGVQSWFPGDALQSLRRTDKNAKSSTHGGEAQGPDPADELDGGNETHPGRRQAILLKIQLVVLAGAISSVFGMALRH